MKKSVSIIIPNYNGQHLLARNLPAVIQAAAFYSKESDTITEIIIVDDASEDTSLAFLEVFREQNQTKYVQLILIRNPHNLGFASTINHGVMKATGEILFLLNSDVTPEENFLPPLIDHFSDETVFAVSCTERSIEQGKVVMRGRGIGAWKRGFLVHQAGKLDKTNTLWVSGGSSAFRKSYWERLNGFDPLYNPFYWEDIDLSYRALKSGYTVLIEPKSIVTHEHGKGAIKTKYSPYTVRKIAYRNQLIFVWKNLTDTNLFIMHICWMPYHMIKTLMRRDMAFMHGFLLAIALLPRIILSRKKAKKSFTISDKTVVEAYTE